jgi:hydrogenase 3 maturation protease
MSPSSWQSSTSQFLEQWTQRQNRLPRIAILGIGNTLRSDDAAGVLVARRLTGSGLLLDIDSVLVLEAGHAPENCTTALRCFAPDIVLLIDAADIGEPPGAIRWIGMDEIEGISATTHSLPLSMLAKYLSLELDCEVKLLGIQPESVEVGERICADVLHSVNEIVDEISTRIMTTGCRCPI